MVLQGVLDFFRVSFLIAGHTKFRPDILFSKTYSMSDVFTTAELKDNVIARSADVTVDKGSIIHVWRESVATKYSKVPGIRLHFLQASFEW